MERFRDLVTGRWVKPAEGLRQLRLKRPTMQIVIEEAAPRRKSPQLSLFEPSPRGGRKSPKGAPVEPPPRIEPPPPVEPPPARGTMLALDEVEPIDFPEETIDDYDDDGEAPWDRSWDFEGDSAAEDGYMPGREGELDNVNFGEMDLSELDFAEEEIEDPTGT